MLGKVQKYLCSALAFLSVGGDCQGSNAGRGVGGKPAEYRSPDTLPFGLPSLHLPQHCSQGFSSLAY